MKPLTLIIAIFLVFATSVPLSATLEVGINPVVRVLIRENIPEVRLILRSSFQLIALDSGKIVMAGKNLKDEVIPTADGISIGRKIFKTDGVRAKVFKDSSIYIDGRRFRGVVDIIVTKKDDKPLLMIVNHIPIEKYLYGVLHHEVSHIWPLEALKAQAIIARTFALNQMQESRSKQYDLRSDIYSQVYGGSTSEKWRVKKAVDLTRGQALVYKDKFFPTYYHATCAGHTEDASNLWNVEMPALKGVQCIYCKDSPHYKWDKTIPLKDIEKKLTDNGYKTGKIASFVILSKNQSGRADKLEIKDTSNNVVVLSAKDFRQILGPNLIRSTNFEAAIKEDRVEMRGLGWGHGVGACQWGLRGMAWKGKSADEIMKHYYPGSEVVKLYR